MRSKTSALNVILIILIVSLLYFAIDLFAISSENYIKFQIRDRSELDRLTRVTSIHSVTGLTVYAFATQDELHLLERLGYAYEKLPHPSTLSVPRMAASKSAMYAWDSYPTYDAYISMMYQFAIDHPGLCQIINAGSTVNGRSILFAKISRNVGIEEDEPEVMFTSSIHGNELTGYVLSLRLIDSLLAGYGTDSLITRLVDSCEIWINPLANPDGTYAYGNNTVYGSTRNNANGIDLNRNFPDPDNGPHPDGHAWQPETVVMMNIADQLSWVISGNQHGGAEVLNYPWDTWARLHADNAWFVDACRRYADTVHNYAPPGYMIDLDDGITNGYAWFSISGGRQDYMNYWRGCREVTMEISQTMLIDASLLPAHWIYNRASFLNWLENALYGIRGIVSDSITGQPLFATITAIGHDSGLDSSRVFTDPDVGDYHRMIEPGEYTLEFKAAGYSPKTVPGVSVSSGDAVRVDVMLSPLPDIPNFAFSRHDAGIVFPGDSVSMHVALVNTGSGDGIGPIATLSSTDPQVAIAQPYSTFPDISAFGGVGTSDSAFRIVVSQVCPLDHVLPFRLDITTEDGKSDTVFFDIVVGQLIEDFESSGFAMLPWMMDGAQNWIVTTAEPFEGTCSAKSGDIGDDQFSEMAVTLDVRAPGNITFNFRVSSEPGWDHLQFFVDGALINFWSGEFPWTEAGFPVAAGTHTFTWRYDKDSYISLGNDCAWVDYIIFPPLSLPEPMVTTVSLPSWTAGHPYTQHVTASGGLGALIWSDKYGDLIGTGLTLSADGLLSGTPLGGPDTVHLSFTAQVIDQIDRTGEQTLELTIHPAVTILSDSLPSGLEYHPYSHQLQASGGTGTIVWSDKNGDLASTGLTLSAAGLLSGSVDDTATPSFIALARDSVGASSEKALSIIFLSSYRCGDANSNGSVDIGDPVFLINYCFRGGSAPAPYEAGMANGDDTVDVGDAVHLINYIFRSGSAPICPEKASLPPPPFLLRRHD